MFDENLRSKPLMTIEKIIINAKKTVRSIGIVNVPSSIISYNLRIESER